MHNTCYLAKNEYKVSSYIEKSLQPTKCLFPYCSSTFKLSVCKKLPTIKFNKRQKYVRYEYFNS